MNFSIFIYFLQKRLVQRPCFLFFGMVVLTGSRVSGQTKFDTDPGHSTEVVKSADENPCCCIEEVPFSCKSVSGKSDTEKIYYIYYDFKSQKFAFPEGYEKLRRTNAVALKVLNYNPFLYKVIVAGKDSGSRSIVDNNNFLSSLMNYSNLAGIVAGIGQGTVANAVANAGKSAKIPGDAHSYIALSEYKFDSAVKVKNQHSEKKVDACLSRVAELIDSNLIEIAALTAEFRTERQKILEVYFQWDKILGIQRKLYPTCNDFLSLASRRDSVKIQYEAIVTDVDQYFSRIADKQRNFLFGLSKCLSVLSNDDNKALLGEVAQIKSFYQTAFDNIAVLDSGMSAKTRLNMEAFFDRTEDVKPCYTSAPIYLLDDMKTLSFSLVPWNDSLRLSTYSDVTIQLPWTPRNVYGISGGLYWGSLHSDQYSVLTTDSVTHSISKNRSGSGEIGINALAYVGFKLRQDKTDYQYLGPAIGGAMSLESNPKPRVMLGCSYIYGHANRFLATVGIVAGSVSKLSNVYEPGTNYTSTPTGVTTSSLKAGLFFSINYSFL